MNSRNITRSPSTQPAAVADRNTHAAGGAATVEIEGFPQTLYARMLGDPDTLLIPLLEATREAYGLVERLSAQGEERSSAVSLCAMHLASSLLRDSQFSLGAKGMSPDNSYSVNFEAGTLHAVTRLYSVVNRRTSFFKVELAGNIAGGPFVVRDPVQGTVIMQVEEEKLRQPNFFASTLPNECVRAQLDQERFGRIQDSPFPESNGDVRMMVDFAGKGVPVLLRRKEKESGWDIIDGRQLEWVGSLSPEMETHLTAVTNFIRELFDK